MASDSPPAYLPFRGVENDQVFYSPLDPGSQQIRYVELHPGDTDDPLVCSLGTTTIRPDASKRVPYEGLSYCWGSINNQVSITLHFPTLIGHHVTEEILPKKHPPSSLDTKEPDVLPQSAPILLLETILLLWLFLLMSMLQLDLLSKSDLRKMSAPSRKLDPALEEMSSASFRITRNLEGALLALRETYSRRRLWIDAICINQMDDAEKTHQVGQMSNIYASAMQVIVWLGNADSSSRTMLRGRELLEQEIQKRLAKNPPFYYGPFPRSKANLSKTDWDYIGASFSEALSKDEQMRDILNPPKTSKEETQGVWTTRFVKSLDLFFGRPWFQRIWVYPEVILAKCDDHGNRLAAIVIGDTSMCWQELNEFVRTLEHISDTYGYFGAESSHNLTWYRDSWYWPTISPHSRQDLSFIEYFARTVNFQASDPRDKLFALLSLARDTSSATRSDPQLRPNYEKSVMAIILDFGKAGIKLPFVINTNRRDMKSSPWVKPDSDTFNFGLWYSTTSSQTDSEVQSPSYFPGMDYAFKGTTLAIVGEKCKPEQVPAKLRSDDLRVFSTSNGGLVSCSYDLKPRDEIAMCAESKTPFVMSPLTYREGRYDYVGPCNFWSETALQELRG